jgi:hypothetical protein
VPACVVVRNGNGYRILKNKIAATGADGEVACEIARAAEAGAGAVQPAGQSSATQLQITRVILRRRGVGAGGISAQRQRIVRRRRRGRIPTNAAGDEVRKCFVAADGLVRAQVNIGR